MSMIRARLREESKSGDHGPDESAEQRHQWRQAPAPAQVGRRILEGVFERQVPPERIGLLANAVHWTYGTLWGGAYGLAQGTLHMRPLRAGVVFGTAVWGASYVLLPAMNLYKPIWEYPAKMLALDLSYHLVYGLTVAATYERLEKM
jgi:hypothetical protein